MLPLFLSCVPQCPVNPPHKSQHHLNQQYIENINCRIQFKSLEIFKFTSKGFSSISLQCCLLLLYQIYVYNIYKSIVCYGVRGILRISTWILFVRWDSGTEPLHTPRKPPRMEGGRKKAQSLCRKK
jgi:hypothetical protein